MEGKGKRERMERENDRAALHKKLSNILQTNESSKVTSFKDKVSCITGVEACFIGLMEVL